jgi:hypothetical protein
MTGPGSNLIIKTFVKIVSVFASFDLENYDIVMSLYDILKCAENRFIFGWRHRNPNYSYRGMLPFIVIGNLGRRDIKVGAKRVDNPFDFLPLVFKGSRRWKMKIEHSHANLQT